MFKAQRIILGGLAVLLLSGFLVGCDLLSQQPILKSAPTSKPTPIPPPKPTPTPIPMVRVTIQLDDVNCNGKLERLGVAAR